MKYRYLEFEIDEDSFSISRDGKLLSVEPRVLEVLIYLIAHRERMVTKRELLAQVWRGIAVTDSALTRCVCLLRQLLGRPNAIRTIHARGYQWLDPACHIVAAGTRLAESNPSLVSG
jgi:DNA-binding winged helix-turn-helix (wHTH) protein